jgi:hypothetical protein
MTKRRVVYGKPLVKGMPSSLDIEKVKTEALERAGVLAIKEIQKEIKRASWNNSPKNLLESFSYEVKSSSLEIHSDHPAAKYIEKGVKPHQMTYLTKAKGPIPIVTEKGDVIFRNPSSSSMSNGGWQHSGIKGKHFLEKGVEKAKEEIKKEVIKAYKDMVLKTLTGK